MDPQATWAQLLQAYREQDWPAVAEHAKSLLSWMDRSGFPPQTLAPPMGSEWDEALARAACGFAREQAMRNGEPP